MTPSQEITLLLVEDDDVDAEGVERAFLDHKISNPIVRATDGLVALEILESKQVVAPYVILLDLNMPRMGGIEFLETIRKHPVHKDAVIFVLTTSASEQDVIATYSNHISGYFVKHEMGYNFFEIARLFDGYWKIVKLPPHK